MPSNKTTWAAIKKKYGLKTRKTFPFSKANKYGAKKTVVDGITFDSKREAAYYGELKMKKAAGMIVDIQVHVRFDLYAYDALYYGFTTVGKHEVDFIVTLPGGMREAHEVKGVETAVWKLKRKIFEANNPHISYKVIK